MVTWVYRRSGFAPKVPLAPKRALLHQKSEESFPAHIVLNITHYND